MGLSTFDAFKHLRSDSVVHLDDAQLQRLRQLLREMLRDIVRVCEKHGIAYTLGGGSVLGALRHGGMIPWDDDVDLNMPRADHDRFVRCFQLECGDRYWVHTPQSYANYGLLMTQVRLKGTMLRTRDDLWHEECGVCVDIFVVENTFDFAPARLLHGVGAMGLGLAVSCRKFFRDRKMLMDLAKGDRRLARVFRIKIALGGLISFLSLDAWTHGADRWNAMCRSGASRYVTIPSGRRHFFGELYRRDGLCSARMAEFDGMLCRIPQDAEGYLRNLYGDYMRIPSEDERERHAYFPPVDF